MTDADTDGVRTWGELFDETVERLRHGQCPDPEISARRIVEETTGTEGASYLDVLDLPATQRGVARLDHLVARRLTGEPLQYVLGRWSFRSLDLMVDRRVLIPRPETEVVAGRALMELERVTVPGAAAPTAVDLGTGSGAIGLAIASEHPTAEVWLTDRSSDAVAVARANLAGLGRHGSRVRIVEGSWFEPLDPALQGHLDLIVSNPPYVAESDELDVTVRDWEPAEALFARDGGVADLFHLVDAAPEWLAPRGALVLEMAPGQVDAVAERSRSWAASTEVIVDLAGQSRGLVARVSVN